MMSVHGMMQVSFAVNGDAIDASPGFTIGTCRNHISSYVHSVHTCSVFVTCVLAATAEPQDVYTQQDADLITLSAHSVSTAGRMRSTRVLRSDCHCVGRTLPDQVYTRVVYRLFTKF